MKKVKKQPLDLIVLPAIYLANKKSNYSRYRSVDVMHSTELISNNLIVKPWV